MNNIYNTNANIKLDSCWLNNKDGNNQEIEKYALYYNDNAKEENVTGSLPSIATEHLNLRGRPGYGLSDDYLIDTYSSLRNNQDAMTRDRVPIQLSSRIFQANPKLTGQPGNIDRELDLLSGSDTRVMPTLSNADKTTNMEHYPCNKSIMELQTNQFVPLLDNIKVVQNPENIIMSQTRGGEDTRSYVNKLKFNKCNKKSTL